MAMKVGSLDDPIWNEPLPTGARPDPGAAKSRRWRIAATVAVALAAVVSVLAIRSGHPGGDPNEVILSQIRGAVDEAIPPGSVPASSQFARSEWQGCGYGSGGLRWSQPTGGTATRLTDAAVVSDASVGLLRHGWHGLPGASSTYAAWTKDLGGASLAELRLVKGYAIPDGWTAWADATVGGATCTGASGL